MRRGGGGCTWPERESGPGTLSLEIRETVFHQEVLLLGGEKLPLTRARGHPSFDPVTQAGLWDLEPSGRLSPSEPTCLWGPLHHLPLPIPQIPDVQHLEMCGFKGTVRVILTCMDANHTNIFTFNQSSMTGSTSCLTNSHALYL